MSQPVFRSSPEETLEWAWSERGPASKIRFVTKVELTGYDFTEFPREAWQRIACFAIVSHLKDKSLDEALRSLSGIYEWQTLDNSKMSRPPERTSFRVSAVRQLERPPLAFDED